MPQSNEKKKTNMIVLKKASEYELSYIHYVRIITAHLTGRSFNSYDGPIYKNRIKKVEGPSASQLFCLSKVDVYCTKSSSVALLDVLEKYNIGGGGGLWCHHFC